MKVTQGEINKLARKIAKVNTALQDAYGLMGELLSDEIIIELVRNTDDHSKIVNKLTKTFQSINKKDDKLIDLRLRESDAQDFDSLVSMINEALYEIEQQEQIGD